MKCKLCKKEFERKESNGQLYCMNCKTKICQHCGKQFICTPKQSKAYKGLFCSMACYHKHRWGATGKCKGCGLPLAEKQIMFCSSRCRKNYWNKDINQSHKKRIWTRKKELIKELGGKCVVCGITDIRVLDIHHKKTANKQQPKNGNYNWGHRFKDWAKNKKHLELLCANCHRIHTWKQRNFCNV